MHGRFSSFSPAPSGCNNQWYWAHRLTGFQAAVRLPSLFASVFGDAEVGAGKRVRPVLAGQVGLGQALERGVQERARIGRTDDLGAGVGGGECHRRRGQVLLAGIRREGGAGG